ncbi:MAG: DNA-deoxyinosine glycosylase [Methanoregula sp.]|nr:DNA-deoxyinosine glycosylase [Methanoregula sp.]
MADLCRTGFSPGDPAGFPAVAGDTPRILILGSFPSVLSLRHTEYYGNPQNHFWKIMDQLFGINHLRPYRERIACLTGHRIALWDVVRTCTRAGSADEQIREPVFNDISGFLTAHPTVQLIVLNGSTAGRYYRRMHLPHAIEHHILPSTSPANTRYTLAEKINAWQIVRANCEKLEGA